MSLLTTLLAILLAAIPIPAEIPDFSRTGYMWSDKPLPRYDVKCILTPPSDGEDATETIQRAIDDFKGKGAILLSKGTWNVSGTIHMNKSGLVLRGEGDETVVVATGKSKRSLIYLGEPCEREYGPHKSKIMGDYFPVGTFALPLEEDHPFKKGDRIVVSWYPSQKWISDLKMDQIPPRWDGIPVKQWTPDRFIMHFERTVVDVRDNVVYMENPLVLALDAQYGEYHVSSYSYDHRVTESGIENMCLVSEYESEEDEKHSWTAIEVNVAEHCWVKNIHARYFCFACVDMREGAKNITVDSSSYEHPKARTTGSRKYGFYFNFAQQSLVSNCVCIGSRHGFATGQVVCGPNVFVYCTEIDGCGDCGPHMRWATGILYDNVETDSLLRVQDRSNMGPSHGWAGVNHVLWNCTAKILVCQNPWVMGKNYCIGCIGRKHPGSYKGRPDGEWISHGTHVEPRSLYFEQLRSRNLAKIKAVPKRIINKTK